MIDPVGEAIAWLVCLCCLSLALSSSTARAVLTVYFTWCRSQRKRRRHDAVVTGSEVFRACSDWLESGRVRIPEAAGLATSDAAPNMHNPQAFSSRRVFRENHADSVSPPKSQSDRCDGGAQAGLPSWYTHEASVFFYVAHSSSECRYGVGKNKGGEEGASRGKGKRNGIKKGKLFGGVEGIRSRENKGGEDGIHAVFGRELGITIDTIVISIPSINIPSHVATLGWYFTALVWPPFPRPPLALYTSTWNFDFHSPAEWRPLRRGLPWGGR